MEIIRKFRWCPRCERLRSLGNFCSSSRGKKTYTRRVCMLCAKNGGSQGRRHVTMRLATEVTDKGRAYLAAERAA